MPSRCCIGSPLTARCPQGLPRFTPDSARPLALSTSPWPPRPSSCSRAAAVIRSGPRLRASQSPHPSADARDAPAIAANAPGAAPSRPRRNLHIGGRELPAGSGAALVLVVSMAAMVLTGDVAPIVATVSCSRRYRSWFMSRRTTAAPVEVRRGREHLRSAPRRGALARSHRRAPRQRAGAGAQPALAGASRGRAAGRRRSRRRRHDRTPARRRRRRRTPPPTPRRRPHEQRLLSEVVARRRAARPSGAAADRAGAQRLRRDRRRPILRLRSSDVYVGESSTLSADEQARLLGEAWERADKPEPLDVRLVIYHRSGRTDTYHLGAHPPSLTPGDLDLIHRLWLDAVKTVGPHVHHHDVVRAALTQMEQQLNGPQRDEALAAIRAGRAAGRRAGRRAARPRLRPAARHDPQPPRRATSPRCSPSCSLEDQVVVFRVLPRKDAAAVFEYLVARRARKRCSRRWRRRTSPRC